MVTIGGGWGIMDALEKNELKRLTGASGGTKQWRG